MAKKTTRVTVVVPKKKGKPFIGPIVRGYLWNEDRKARKNRRKKKKK